VESGYLLNHETHTYHHRFPDHRDIDAVAGAFNYLRGRRLTWAEKTQ